MLYCIQKGSENMLIKVICVTDSYHEPSYYFENGSSIYHSEDEFLNMMCKPHTGDYSLYKLFIEDFGTEEEEENYNFIASFEDMTYEEIKSNFPKLYQICLGI